MEMFQYISCRIRVTTKGGHQLIGKVLACDINSDLILGDCEEFRKLPPTKEEGEDRRTLGLVILSSVEVVSIIVEAPPPPDYNRATAIPGWGLGLGTAPGRGVVASQLAQAQPRLAGPVRGVGGSSPGMMPQVKQGIPPPPPPPGVMQGQVFPPPLGPGIMPQVKLGTPPPPPPPGMMRGQVFYPPLGPGMMPPQIKQGIPPPPPEMMQVFPPGIMPQVKLGTPPPPPPPGMMRGQVFYPPLFPPLPWGMAPLPPNAPQNQQQ